jgi:hypothetical protein
MENVNVAGAFGTGLTADDVTLEELPPKLIA